MHSKHCHCRYFHFTMRTTVLVQVFFTNVDAHVTKRKVYIYVSISSMLLLFKVFFWFYGVQVKISVSCLSSSLVQDDQTWFSWHVDKQGYKPGSVRSESADWFVLSNQHVHLGVHCMKLCQFHFHGFFLFRLQN